MAGILDKKKRFIDLVVTQEGKRQIASGKLRVEYASATDMHAYYDTAEKYEDVTKNIYFEAMERPENSIVLETDDSGRLVQFDISPTETITGKNIFKKENVESISINQLKIATGSQFSSLTTTLTSQFINNFDKNYFVSTRDLTNPTNEFSLTSNQVNFAIKNTIPFPSGPRNEVINVNDAEPFILDKKMAQLPNFAFLPPVNEDGTSYGEYEDYRSTTMNRWSDIIEELGNKAFVDQLAHGSLIGSNFEARSKVLQALIGDSNYEENTDVSIKKDYKVFDFKNTSEHNNILIQLYETNQNKFTKLDIVDGGAFYVQNDQNKNVEKKVFYAGKIYFDDYNTPTFINLFTIILE